jgi:DNA-binding winged helix-turn-helix (wHTH) protein
MSDSPSRQRLRIGPLRIDLTQSTVESEDGAHALTPRAESLLLLLCRHAGRLVSREEIHEKVWAGRVVEDAAITNTIWQIRRALGEQGKDMLHTRAKRGYMLTVPEGAWLADEKAPETETVEAGGLASHSRFRDEEASLFDRNESVTVVAEPALSTSRSRAKRFRQWGLAVAGFALAAVAVYGIRSWRAPPEANARVAKAVLTSDAELTVSVQAPHDLDWVRDAVLRTAVEQAYLREAEVVYFERKQQRNPFAGPHLQVEVTLEKTGTVFAEFSLNDAGETVRGTFRGPVHGLAKAVEVQLEHSLQPPARKSTPASDALVSGLVAGLRFDYQSALVEYRRALARDPGLPEANLAMATLLFDLGRERESLEIAQRLIADERLTKAEECKLGLLLVEAAPELLKAHICLNTSTLWKIRNMEARNVLREIDSVRRSRMSASDWLDIENNAFFAHLRLQELSEAEFRLRQAQRTAAAAGWEHGVAELGTLDYYLAQHKGRVEDAIRTNNERSTQMERLGDLRTAFRQRTLAIRAQRPVPGAMTGRQRKTLNDIIDRARTVGSVRAEVDALQILARLDRDDLPVWRARIARIRELIQQHYAPRQRTQEVHFILNESLAQRQYRAVLEGVDEIERSKMTYPQARLWNLTLRAESQFPRDELDAAMATVDAMEKENFDLSETSTCLFSWLFAEGGKADRARTILKKCPYAEYDRAALAARGDYGLYAEARLHGLYGDPERAWLVLRPRIDQLLATTDITRQEAESLAFLARHATSMPGADAARLRRALEVTSGIAKRDGAGPGLRFGVHVLRWRLCAHEGRTDCGPVLPAWAQEDRLEARLAMESLRTSQSRQ